MRLHVSVLALAAGLIWGSAILLVTVLNLVWPSYGVSFLDVIASIYPGFEPRGGPASVIIGTLYGLTDGAIAGGVLAWLYNALARSS